MQYICNELNSADKFGILFQCVGAVVVVVVVADSSSPHSGMQST